LADEGSITFSKDHVYGIVIVALVALLTISVLTSGFGIVSPKSTGTDTCNGGTTVTNTSTGTAAGTDTYAGLAPLTVGAGDLPADGQDSAAVTWIEFSDYQCPFCSRLYLQTDSLIKSNYVATGKVKMYFRDFPLSFHDKSNIAAMAARCANAQGKFWEMHGKLFEDQATWGALSASDAPSAFSGYASGLGMDASKFGSCMSAGTYASDINKDLTGGQNIGVQGTPGVFLLLPKSKTDYNTLKSVVAAYGDGMTVYQDNDNLIVFVAGAYPYSAFSAILNTVTY